MTNSCDTTTPTTPISIVEAYRGRTILITGGRGFIGSALTQTLSDVNCKLILLDQSPEDVWKPTGQEAEVVLLQGDVAIRNTWGTALPNVDIVFHLAAREYHYRSEYDQDQDLRFNALPSLHLLEVCRTHKFRPHIVFASSANVFGSVATLPVNEDHPDNPLTLWAIHKLTAERYFCLYTQKFGIKSVILRLANAYGPAPRRDVMTRMVLNKMIANALDRETLTTYINQDCNRDFIFIEDVLQAFLLAGMHRDSNVCPMYVIGSGENRTIGDVWRLIAETVSAHTGRRVPIRCDESVEIEPVEMRHFTADSTRFQKETGWKPKTELTEGIDRTVRTLLPKYSRSKS